MKFSKIIICKDSNCLAKCLAIKVYGSKDKHLQIR